APELDRFSFDARADPERAELPILMLSERANDLTFAHALAAGLDDVVPLDSSRGLVRRLRGLRAERAQRTPGSRGHALLAEADARRRISIGRALRSAGYAVKFAVTADDATTYAAYSD